MSQQETLYAMALTRIVGFHHEHALQLYQHYGSAQAVYECRHDVTAQKWSCPPRLAAALANWDEPLKRAEQEMAFAAKHSISILTPADEGYPQRLAQCPDAPLVLYYRGTASLNAGRIVSVVGTRHCTPYGHDLVARLMGGLRQLCPDALIVSGLAYGVDIAAHRQALQSGMSTVAVLAHGLDRIYPERHRNTAKEMATQGGLLTEFMSGTNADKVNFVKRNRIVAGIADATVVVESANKGGALITAGIANSYGRDVFAFPGAVGAKYSEGCNQLIRTNEAALITEADHLAEAMQWATPGNGKRHHNAHSNAVEQQLFPELSPQEQCVANLLQTTNDLQSDIISVKTGIPPGQLLALLFQMEMKGLVAQLAGGMYHWKS